MSVALREYQLFQLDILREFARICERNDLRWFAGYGTLLGAARHQGFIPWDDDIDVFMPAKDYYRFRGIVERDLGERFYFQCHCVNPENFISWQRIGVRDSTSMPVDMGDIHAEWGICIDIFPLGCGRIATDAEKEAVLRRFDALKKISRRSLYRHDAKSMRWGIGKAYHLLMACETPSSNVCRWRRAELSCFPDTELVPGQIVYDGWGMFCPSECFCGFETLPFEGMDISVPKHYEVVLDDLYGKDWRELPPEEKRVWHSGGGSDEVRVSLEEPYEKYYC